MGFGEAAFAWKAQLCTLYLTLQGLQGLQDLTLPRDLEVVKVS